ncbi:DNA polymerase III subunit delta [Gemmata obscuriglobus]|uniref:DNA polymerase III subunit delta n=1 Tax=Gemmata obscuriglobus TaxID=114 RepID=A0A2Z3GPE4_9BACT|nr:DNA polymerase III subunit delta [Gemmata obscuriglobus]AWM36149.1 DNA polymerase III subunit delta [Gemmata obscuriglobus]QEG31260.1 DNA polymerase III subunit delta [Gemmata obscuriglobus]VTS10598.1 dna polymerase iii subunit delta : DNA polymerase III, delta subunit OS=Singulisphaera acidiphila (strain ATCC BAA-1392 / DSM 18658 / VKM B-2454 / MOB10) GN=Sinac_2977 PE=4 SV=1: DNA_pol3_delta: DNA_pol3_gamma3 [Gemmata obscuriglobus UQM 2246]
MDALQFLSAKDAKRHPVYALVGDEDFLKRHARERIISIAIGDEDPSFAVSASGGDRLDFSTARNELETLPFLAPCRVLIVDAADKFVTENRQALEAYAAKPSAVGVLVLDVKTFPENTKLAKALPDGAKIVCKAPPEYKIGAWCVEWAKTAHKKKLATEAAELLVERVGTSMGLLDQELGKLANAVGAKPVISADDVDTLVGRSKAADVFRIMDAIGDGKPAQALSILQELFAEGEDPMAVIGPLTAQLRKLATVGRLMVVEKLPMGSAMDAANVPKWEKARVNCEKQLKHLGGPRLLKLPDWLVEINYGLKGGNPLPERVQVERLIVMLARPREDVKK